MKVFGIGMFRTGTSTLGKALDILGFKTLHGPWWDKSRIIIDNWYEYPEEWPKYKEEFIKEANEWDAFEDYPWMFNYEMMDEAFSDAKFILTTRDPEDVAKSDINARKQEWKKQLLYGNKVVKIPSKQKFINRYVNHRDKVREYFRYKNNFLEVCWMEGDGWEKLCNFLNMEIPNIPFPHKNKGKYT
ncbi:MAG: sulfotransferase family protein [bacterium]